MRKDKPRVKKLGVMDGWALGTGAMVGATVFVASGMMSGMAGPAAALSFMLCAGVTLVIAACYCELSSAFPRSGGAYIYPKETLNKNGELMSFITGWSFYGGQGLGSAVLALTCSYYINWTLELLGFLNPIPDNIFAMMIIVFFAAGNIIDTRWGNAIQVVSTFAVTATLLLFVVWGGANVDPQKLTPFMPNGFSSVVAAGAAGWAAFGGWSAIPNMSGEFRNPSKDVPRSMVLSLVTCGVLFGIIVLVMNGLMDYNQLGAEKAPLAAAAAAFTRYGAIIIACGGIFAAISTLNGLMMTGSHMLASMGREGSMPRVVARKRSNGTPWVAIMVTGIGMLFLASTGLMYIILQMVAFVTAFTWIIACLCVYALRKNRTDLDPLYKTPLYPVTPAAAVILALLMISRMATMAIVIGCVWVAIGLCLYLVFHHTALKKYCDVQTQEKSTKEVTIV